MRITAHESSPHLDLRLRSRFTLIAANSASRNKNAGARLSAHAAHDPRAMHLTAPRFMAAVDDITRFLSAHLPTATS